MAFGDKLERLNAQLNMFMQGRYGSDHLGLALVSGAAACYLVDLAFRPIGSIVGWFLIVAAIWRMLSRDMASRRAENERFLALVSGPARSLRRQRTKWQNRKTKAYVRCPHCKTEFALPKGKGHLRATCPHCGEKSEHTV